MKKTNKFLFLMTTLILLPLSVKADMVVPEIQPYEAYITNPNGINVVCGEENYTLKLDEVVKVVSESDNDVNIEYKNHYCSTISINDIKPIIEEYKPEEHIDEVEKLNNPRKIKIIKENGLELYSGPSSAFKKIITVPKDVELTYSYSSGNDNEIKPVWLYATYKGKSGWIKTGQESEGEHYLLFHFNNQLPIVEDTTLITKDNQKIPVPKNTVFNEGYMTHENFGSTNYAPNFYYVEYNNIYGEIQFAGLIDSKKIKLNKSHILYDISEHDYYREDNPDGIPIITITMKGNKIGTIPEGAKLSYNIAIEDYPFEIAYIEYEGKKGWILLKYDRGDNKEYDFEFVENNEEITTTTTTTTTKPVIKTEKETFSAKELIYFCIGGAVILSLTAIVTIILINKNKKSKNNEIINNTQE